jgi:hypothetical protein
MDVSRCFRNAPKPLHGATRGLLEIIVFMLILSLLRTRIDWKKTGSTLR